MAPVEEPSPDAKRITTGGEYVNASDPLIFAVVPKTVDNRFFHAVRDGCVDQANRLTKNLDRLVICKYTGAREADGEDIGVRQMETVVELLNNPRVMGISVSIQSEEDMKLALELGRDEFPHKPIVTFDSDLTENTDLRRAYIGTNNTFFGRELARAMLQLHPTIGNFSLLYNQRTPNMLERVNGFVKEVKARSEGWNQMQGSPANVGNNLTRAINLLDEFAENNATAIVSLMGFPMRNVGNNTDDRPWKEMFERHVDKPIHFLCGDAMPHQLEFLASGYVHALIGQLPYEMGSMSITMLSEMINLTSPSNNNEMDYGHDHVRTILSKDKTENSTFKATNVLSHLFVPLEIPKYDVDDNTIGKLSIVGYFLFAVITVTGLLLLLWTINHRNVRVVQVAQPKFLAMVIFGIMIFSTCLVPLSMDDGGDPDNLTEEQAVEICMTVPWVASIGFTTTFSALYAKTRRINQIFHSNSAFARVRVSEREVLMPFTILLLANFVVLTVWTVIDPLTYTRTDVMGADGWNRVLETYGGCRSDHVERYLIPLVCLNLGVLLMANWQAFEARHIEAEFSETKYIAICMASLLQASISGVPILFVVQDKPVAFYLVLVFMIFIISMGTLLIIFVPKISFARLFMARSQAEQRDFISKIIQKSSVQSSKSKWSRGGQQGPGYGFDPKANSAFQSAWAQATPTVAQLNYGPTQNESESQRDSQGNVADSDEVGTGELLTKETAPEERISSLTEDCEYINGRASDSAGYGMTIGGVAMKAGSVCSGDQIKSVGQSTTASYFTGKSSHTPSAHGSVRSFYSTTPRQSARNLFTPKQSTRNLFTPMASQRSLLAASAHHPIDEHDDPSEGMLVFRTMSIRADGSLAPSSISSMSRHTRISRFDAGEMEDESFSTGTWASASPHPSARNVRRTLSNGSQRKRAPSSRNVASNPTSMPKSNPTRSMPKSNSLRLGRIGGTLSNGRNRVIGRKNSTGKKRQMQRLPPQLLRAIEEKTGGDSSTDLEYVVGDTRGSSNILSVNSSMPELKAIEENGSDDCGDSVSGRRNSTSSHGQPKSMSWHGEARAPPARMELIDRDALDSSAFEAAIELSNMGAQKSSGSPGSSESLKQGTQETSDVAATVETPVGLNREAPDSSNNAPQADSSSQSLNQETQEVRDSAVFFETLVEALHQSGLQEETIDSAAIVENPLSQDQEVLGTSSSAATGMDGSTGDDPEFCGLATDSRRSEIS